MTRKSFKGLFAEARRRNSFWSEKAKIDFAEDLWELMERRGVSRAQLAERIGSSAAYVTKALRGDANFTIESMVKLVRALDGQLTVHVGAAEDKPKYPRRQTQASSLVETKRDTATAKVSDAP
jgi:transcriptional regulator with XRE-family HTH domain